MPEASTVDSKGQDLAAHGQPWFFVKDVEFLPSSGDFTLICNDTKWNGVPNPGGGATAFKVSRADLENWSGFFRDMFSVVNTQQRGGGFLHCGEASKTVAVVLQAAFQSKGAKLRSHDCWPELTLALSLAIKWSMPEARQHLLWSQLALVADVKRSIYWPASQDIVPFFAQATLSGGASLVVAERLWRTRAKERKVEFPITPIEIDPHIFMELGPSLCSSVVQTILTLVQDGILKMA